MSATYLPLGRPPPEAERRRHRATCLLPANSAVAASAGTYSTAVELLGRVGPRLVQDYELSFLDAAIAWCDRALA